MDTNDYKQKLMDLLVLEMGKKRLFDNSGLKKFVAITAETLQKNKTTDFTDALFQVTNFAFSVGFNEGLQHSMELMNKVEKIGRAHV